MNEGGAKGSIDFKIILSQQKTHDASPKNLLNLVHQLSLKKIFG